MSQTWYSDARPPDPVPVTIFGWLRAVLRGTALIFLVFGGLLLLLLVRLLEAPICRQNRPVTPHITQFVCRGALVILGMGFDTKGSPMATPGAVVANHVSWLDIFALNARNRIYFVAKHEVAGWPGVGWLARATGTVFIKRERREASTQIKLFRRRLSQGHKLLFFPEGSSSDGIRVLPFKSTLFASFLTSELRLLMWVQPVTVNYYAPKECDERFYGWWGSMALGPHLLQVLSAAPQGRVELVYHAPVRAADFSDRKALSSYCEDVVRAGLQGAIMLE